MYFYQLSIAQTERGNHNPEKDICSTPTWKSLRIKKFYKSMEDRQPNRKHGQRAWKPEGYSHKVWILFSFCCCFPGENGGMFTENQATAASGLQGLGALCFQNGSWPLFKRHSLLCWCCSVAKSCLTLCDPVNCSMPGFPVLHYSLLRSW